MREIKGQNGAKIVINASSMKNVKRLRQCIAKELLKHKIDLGNTSSLTDIANTLKDNLPKLINLLKDVLLGMEISEEFETVIYACLSDCTYNNIQIREQLFDDIPEAREDYDRIILEVIKENLAPFTKGLLGTSSISSLMTKESSQK